MRTILLSALLLTLLQTNIHAQEADSLKQKLKAEIKAELREEILLELTKEQKQQKEEPTPAVLKGGDVQMPINPNQYYLRSDEHSRIKLSGMIRHDVFADTRQTISLGEGIAVLAPRDELLDANGKDINNKGNFHMLSIISRLSLDFTGPKVLGAQTSGVLEGEYFGNSEASINELRLRNAWVRLDWKNTQLGVGQWWHPFMDLEAIPNTVNYSTGAPFMPLSRNPQIRLTHNYNKFRIAITALSQRDFTPNTAPYRQSGIPQFNLATRYKGEKFIVGAVVHFEKIKPLLASGTPTVKSDETLTSLSAKAYVKFITKPIAITLEAGAYQNAASFLGLGGYVGYLPDGGGVEVYRTVNTYSSWIDFQWLNSKKIIPGLFAGYVKNDGVKNPIENATATSYGLISSLGAMSATEDKRTVSEMFKIIPRVDFMFGKLRFRLEGEYSNAKWVDAENTATGSENVKNIDNLRIQFATIFFF